VSHPFKCYILTTCLFVAEKGTQEDVYLGANPSSCWMRSCPHYWTVIEALTGTDAECMAVHVELIYR